MLDGALEACLHFAQDVPIDVLEEDLFAKLTLRLGESRNALMRMIGLFVSRGRRCLGRNANQISPTRLIASSTMVVALSSQLIFMGVSA